MYFLNIVYKFLHDTSFHVYNTDDVPYVPYDLATILTNFSWYNRKKKYFLQCPCVTHFVFMSLQLYQSKVESISPSQQRGVLIKEMMHIWH